MIEILSRCEGVTVPNSESIIFKSRANGHTYALSIAYPEKQMTGRVMVVLDGSNYFASAVELVRSNLNAPDVTVVGIGYPVEKRFCEAVLSKYAPLPGWLRSATMGSAVNTLLRLRDLSLPSSQADVELLERSGLPRIRQADTGGVDSFLETLATDVAEILLEKGPVDLMRSALFGHSLGGHAVLRALFSVPALFGNYIAASPSIWWNNNAVLQGEQKFTQCVLSGKATPRILITLGGREEEVDTHLAEFMGVSAAEQATTISSVSMIELAKALRERLADLPRRDRFEVAPIAVFDGFTHGTSGWPALALGTIFAFQGDKS